MCEVLMGSLAGGGGAREQAPAAHPQGERARSVAALRVQDLPSCQLFALTRLCEGI
jgi:hypothetical protein